MQVAPRDSPRGRSAIPSPQELGSECFAANSIGSADLTHELPMAARSHSILQFAASTFSRFTHGDAMSLWELHEWR